MSTELFNHSVDEHVVFATAKNHTSPIQFNKEVEIEQKLGNKCVETVDWLQVENKLFYLPGGHIEENNIKSLVSKHDLPLWVISEVNSSQQKEV